MKIIVLLKQVPVSFQAKLNQDLTIDRASLGSMLNPADDTALDVALKLTSGEKIIGLSMGPTSTIDCLREVAILGVRGLCLITDPCLAGADSLVTAQVLARAIQYMGGADLILCGYKTVDGETGQVGPELAYYLGYHCLTGAVSVAKNSEDEVECFRLTREEEQMVRLSLPAVISMRSTPVAHALPTLNQLREGKKVPVQILSAVDLGFEKSFSAMSASPTKVLKVERKLNGYRKCTYLHTKPEELKELASIIKKSGRSGNAC